MSNETHPPDDPRVIAFLQQFPNAKLDGFDPDTEKRLRAKACGVPAEEKKLEPPKDGCINAETLAVIVAVGDSVHQVVLSREQRQMVLGLIAEMHEGQPRLHADPVENLNVEAFAPKIHVK